MHSRTNQKSNIMSIGSLASSHILDTSKDRSPDHDAMNEQNSLRSYLQRDSDSKCKPQKFDYNYQPVTVDFDFKPQNAVES